MSGKPDNDSKGETGDANVLEDFMRSRGPCGRALFSPLLLGC